MKRLAAILLCLFLALPADAAPQDAVVRIDSHGVSGTAIATQGNRTWVLTCAHGFEGRGRYAPVTLDVQTPGGWKRYGSRFRPRVDKIDWTSDLALVVVEAKLPNIAHVAPAGMRIGRCVSAGYDEMKAGPRGEPTVRTATIIGYETREDMPRYAAMTREQPWHGRSGGALIDTATGRLVGVVSGYTTEPNRVYREGGPNSHGVYSSHASILRFVWPSTRPTLAPPPMTAESRGRPVALSTPPAAFYWPSPPACGH